MRPQFAARLRLCGPPARRRPGLPTRATPGRPLRLARVAETCWVFRRIWVQKPCSLFGLGVCSVFVRALVGPSMALGCPLVLF